MCASCGLLVVVALAAAPPEPPREPIEIAALIRLIEQADVPAPEAGILAQVHVVEGQMVEQDAALAQIDDTEARAQAEHARMEVEIASSHAQNTIHVRVAQKTVEVARAELRRSTESIEKYQKSVSESEMDRLRLTVEKGLLEVELAEHQLRVAGFTHRMHAGDYQAAQNRVKRLTLTAPLSGVVVQVNRHRATLYCIL
jgi:multidrug efflux pump subunit AcrA (membrane-fusion protein)